MLIVDASTLIGANGLNDKKSKIDMEQLKLAEDFLSKYGEKSKNPIHSYALKHRIEKLVERYISNGAAIKAAVSLGIKVEADDIEGLNANIYIQKKGWNEYFKETPFCHWIRSKAVLNLRIDDDERKFIEDTKTGYFGKKDSYQSFQSMDAYKDYKDFEDSDDFEKFHSASENYIKACKSLYKKYRNNQN